MSAWGSFLDGVGTLGPYCGYSRGPAKFTITIDGTATMTLAEPRGRCGLDPPDGVAPATELDVSATVTWTPVP
ncbi:MAG: hypothetical protein HYU28_07125 [Actinobacteria bacterium]|nr:hypothetical protein [Actinomycetota bacterium]